jgi:Leucine-rich repeat (LRR) protein
MIDDIENLPRREPSRETFAELTRLLDGMRGGELDDAISRVETSLAVWPDEAREAPEAWRRIQEGEPPPRWWSLVRHVRVEHGQSLDVGQALASLTSVDASVVEVDPLPLVAAHRLRFLDLSGNPEFGDLEFLSEMPQLERLLLAGSAQQMDLAPVFALKNLRELDLSEMSEFLDAGALAPLQKLHFLNLSSTSCGATLSALSALPALDTLVIDECDGVTNLAWVQSLPKLSDLIARELHGLVRLDELASASLRSLTLGGKQIVDASRVGKLVALEELTLARTPRLAKLTFLTQLRHLRRLFIEGCKAPLPPLDLPVLDTLVLGWGTHVTDLTPLGGLSSLRQLRIHDARLPDLSPLARLDKLEILALHLCTELGDFSPIAHLPLRLLDLTGSTPLPDPVPVRPGCEVIRHQGMPS